MRKVMPAVGDARNDHDILAGLANRLGVGGAFTGDRDEDQWLRYLYTQYQTAWKSFGVHLPDFNEFWNEGCLHLPSGRTDGTLLSDFREDPDQSPLNTPSGRIEIFSEVVASFGYADCPGYPVWLQPTEWPNSDRPGPYPLQMIVNNPWSRLHSQLDMGATSQAAKVKGREPLRMHPNDARPRTIEDGQVVRVFNSRGSCLAGVVLSSAIRRGVVQMSTGAWYDPAGVGDEPELCVHGNPNVLTRDAGTSRLAQGCTGQTTMVEVEPYRQQLPPIRAYDPPAQRA